MKVLTIILIISLINIGTSQKRYRCLQAPNDYKHHISQAKNFGAQVVDGVVSKKAYSFDGNGQYMDFGTTELQYPLTITYWAAYEAFNQWSRIIDFGNGASSDNILIANEGTSNNFKYDSYKGGQFMSSVVKNDQLILNEWHHYALVINKKAQMSLYIDGQIQSVVQKGNKSIRQIKRKFSYIAKSHWGHDQFFKGKIDDLAIYERELSQQEIECTADLCDETCWNICRNSSKKCEAKPQVVQGQCIIPTDQIYNMKDSYNKGTQEGGMGPVSKSAVTFNGNGFRQFNDMTLGGPFSVSLWAKWDSGNNWQRIIDFGNGPGDYNVLIATQSTSNNLVVQVNFKNGALRQQTNGIVQWGKWVHIVVLFGRGDITTYMNGKKLGSQTDNNKSFVPRVLRKQNYIGKSNWGHDALLKGMIDDLQIFPRILNVEEIECLIKSCQSNCINNQQLCTHYSDFCKSQECATVYSECSFQGEKQEICSDTPALKPMNVKSVYVPQNYKFTLFENKDYANRQAVFTSPDTCIEQMPFK